jgi:hypothetical protein
MSRELVDKENGDPVFQHMRVSAWTRCTVHVTNLQSDYVYDWGKLQAR